MSKITLLVQLWQCCDKVTFILQHMPLKHKGLFTHCMTSSDVVCQSHGRHRLMSFDVELRRAVNHMQRICKYGDKKWRKVTLFICSCIFRNCQKWKYWPGASKVLFLLHFYILWRKELNVYKQLLSTYPGPSCFRAKKQMYINIPYYRYAYSYGFCSTTSDDIVQRVNGS